MVFAFELHMPFGDGFLFLLLKLIKKVRLFVNYFQPEKSACDVTWCGRDVLFNLLSGSWHYT